MSVLDKMKNPIFTAQNLYTMVRLSQMEYFPYPTFGIEIDEVLTLYMRKHLGLDVNIKDMQKERALIFEGKSYEYIKDTEYEEEDRNHSSIWYLSQVAKWGKWELGQLKNDVNMMRSWLENNDYVKEKLPTDKFLKQEFLIIADIDEEKRKSGM